MQTNQVMLLYRLSQVPDNSHPVFDGVCLGGDLDVMERILTRTRGGRRFGRISDIQGGARASLRPK